TEGPAHAASTRTLITRERDSCRLRLRRWCESLRLARGRSAGAEWFTRDGGRMCGIVVALPAYGGRVEQPDLTSLVDLLPSLPDLDGFGSDRDKLESTLHMAAERLAVAVDAYATTGAVLTLANTVDGDPLRRALHQLECTGAELDEALDRDSAAWGADATERVQRMLREVRDQIWTLRHDRVAVAARARALATAGWTPHSVTSYV